MRPLSPPPSPSSPPGPCPPGLGASEPRRPRRSARRSALALALTLAALASPSREAEAQTKTFTLNADFDAGVLNNVRHDPVPDQIVLGRTPVSRTRLVWATNYIPGYVVRIDSKTGKQTGRFDSTLASINGQPTGTPPPNQLCNFKDQGNCPGRVAVDTNGDVWIVNRAFGQQGSLSKFSGDVNHCIDRNGSGVIDTSRDLNGDGIIDTTIAAGPSREYFGQEDECVLETIKIGPSGALPRGVAVDKRGKIWVSTDADGGKLYRINPHQPLTIEKVVTVGGNPYSIASGGDWIYVSNRAAGDLSRVHITSFAIEKVPNCGGTYGVVAHPTQSVAYFGTKYFAQTNALRVANFATKSCTDWSALWGKSPNGSHPSAVTIDLDFNIWGTGHDNNTVIKWSPAGVLLGVYPMGGTAPHGTAIDFDGFLWTINRYTGNVSKLKTDGTLVGTYPIGGTVADSKAAGYFDPQPYLYSDFTGVQIDRQAPYTYLGYWEGKYDGEVPGIAWTSVAWNQEPEGKVPPETSLTLSARAADSLAELATRAYAPVGNGTPIGGGVKGRYVEIRAELRGPGFETSVLSDVTVKGPCTSLGETCCVKTLDCDDEDPCTIDLCPVQGDACVHVPKDGCCTEAADCEDQSICTKDSCDVAKNECVHDLQDGCCLSNADCDDQNPCTADLCTEAGGACEHPTILGCCNEDEDCQKGNVCSAATCNQQNFCEGGSIPGCCTNDADCVDTDLCTEDYCDLTTGTCSNDPLESCCSVDADCFDGDACTKDTCSEPGGSCDFPPIAACCTQESPEVGEDCQPPKAPKDHPPCAPGKIACVMNQLECQGAVKPVPEVCDGEDNDCDGEVDKNASCPAGSVCVAGSCAVPCGGGEFGGCPVDKQCVGGYCLPRTCEGIVCPEGQTCESGVCFDPSVTGPSASASGSSASSGAGQAGGSSATGSPGQGGAGQGGAGEPEVFGLATGSGCNCRAAGGDERGAHDGRAAFMALALAAGASRRRRRARSDWGARR